MTSQMAQRKAPHHKAHRYLWCSFCVLCGVVLFLCDICAASEKSPVLVYDAKGKRDPFVPLVRDGRMIGSGTDATLGEGPRDVSLPLLGGILWDPAGRSIALLNEKEAMVGDVVRGYRVVEIHEDHVVLEQEGRRVTLKMVFEEQVKSDLESQP
jgi:hypothetical protein